MKRKETRKIQYRLMAVLLVFSMLGANLTTLSYASETAGAEPETYCGHEQHVHEEGVCFTAETIMICGVEEGEVHAHGADCFEEQQVLVCQLAEEEAHTHDESCRGEVTEYACGREEAEAHAHGDACYADHKTLTCGRTACEAHTHGEDCFALQDKLTCTEEAYEAHIHGDGCYRQQNKLTCAETEYPAHTHGEGCYGTERQLTCGQSEQAGHSHGDICYTEEKSLSCTSAEEGHQHTDGCYTTSRTLSCVEAETGGHAHGEACYSDVQVCTCTLKVGAGHAHGEGCYIPESVLKCALRVGDGHAHGAGCYTQELVNLCGKQEIAEGHAHSDACYTVSRDLTCGKEEVAEGHAHTEDCTRVESALCCGKEETEGHAHGETCYAPQKVQVCMVETGVPHVHGETCHTKEITMTCQLAEHVHTDACYVEPEPEKILICTDPDHEHTDECYALLDELLEERSITDENNLVTVTGLLPATATVQARPLTEEEIAALPVPVEMLLFAYDITIWVDGEEYQPETPVQVTVLPETEPEQAVQEVLVQHIELNEETSELSVTEVTNTADELTGEVTFEAESFSIYIGTIIKTIPKLELLPGEGYEFYNASNQLISGTTVVWDEAGTTIQVKPMVGFEITGVKVYSCVDEETQVENTSIVPTEADGVWTVAFPASPAAGTQNQLIEVTAALIPGDTIYFDLALGPVTINSSTGYSGKIWDLSTNAVHEYKNVSFDRTKRYYVFQSVNDSVNSASSNYYTKVGQYFSAVDGHEAGSVVLPEYTEITVTEDGKTLSWADYITDNTEVKTIRKTWNELAAVGGRERTKNIITIQMAGRTCELVMDNIWADEEGSYSTGSYGELRVPGNSNAASKAIVRLKGDNSISHVENSGATETGSTLTFTSSEGNGRTEGSLTVISRQVPVTNNSSYLKNPESSNSNNVYVNHWNAVIGTGDSNDHVRGLNFAGGTIYAGSTEWENCTAIGAGGNGTGQVTIHGGRVTAVASTTGTAIGGGIGHQAQGGAGYVTINGGEVYAYNFGQPAYRVVSSYGTSDKDEKNAASHIAGTAIGGASSILSSGAKGTVTINGGYVYAESLGGSGIGGGNSVIKSAGDADVTINGGTVIAKSAKYDNFTTITDAQGVKSAYHIKPGAAIGGGTGGLGKGATAGSAAADKGNGGAAILEINGGTVITGSIGGGSTNSKNNGVGRIGYADVTINGGDVSGQVVMAAGAAKNCSFKMTGGTLHNDWLDGVDFLRMEKKVGGVYTGGAYNGGVVYMDDPNGTATISGGVIRDASSESGGAIYMTAGTLNLSGTGVIQNCEAIAVDGMADSGNGGAIYMGGTGDAEIYISGGALYGNTAPKNGGAIYMTAGTVNMSAGSGDITVKNKEGSVLATLPSGSLSANIAETGNGGAIYMGGGTLTMNGGSLASNTAVAGNGGAIYMGGGMLTMNGGSVSSNTATAGNGGGLGMGGGELHITGGSLSGNHAEAGNGGGAYVENGSVIMSGGTVEANRSQRGAGMYVSALGDVNVGVKLFSGSVINNTASDRGGGIAVVGNPEAANQNIGITVGLNLKHVDEAGNEQVFTHNADGTSGVDGKPDSYTHTDCPVISGNMVTNTAGGGGALYINGSAVGNSKTQLNLYCLDAEHNDVATEDPNFASRSDFMLVDGGKVIISSSVGHDEDDDGKPEYVSPNEDNGYGAVNIQGSLHVTGGQVDMYGNMDNPGFGQYPLTVDVTKPGDHFTDHRYTNSDVRTITYWENFQETPGEEPIGRYTVYHTTVPTEKTTDPEKMVVSYSIASAMYKHDGFTLKGWSTDKVGKPDNTYSANDVLYFEYDENAEGYVKCTTAKNGTSVQLDKQGNLILYGQWKISDYFVDFYPNAPTNVSCSGKMERQTFKYNVAQKLTPNQFVVQNYTFLGWSTVVGGTVVYTDGQEVRNLTDMSGKVIPLYGVWAPCDHSDASKLAYTVVDGKNDHEKILRKECIACHSKHWDVTLTATDGTYTNSQQLARATLSTIPNGFAESPLSVVYDRTPVNAGNYTASVTLTNVNVVETVTDPETGVKQTNVVQGDVTATVKFKIDPTTQDPPAVPEFTAGVNEGTGILTVTIAKCGESAQSGADAEYRLTYKQDGETKAIMLDDLSASEVLSRTENRDAEDQVISFTYEVKLPTPQTLYSVEARYQGTTNYYPSDYVQAEQKITYNGAILKFVYREGIDHEEPTLLSTQANCVVLNISVKKDFYLENGAYTHEIETVWTEGGAAASDKSPIWVDEKEVEIDGIKVKKPVLEGFVSGTTVTVTIGGAKRAAGITARITEKKLFGLDVPENQNNAEISDESAFTAYFKVTAYSSSEYEKLRLEFGRPLPVGTAIVMVDRSGTINEYWYWKAVAETSRLELAEFKKMSGASGVFDPNGDMELQFAVDFSMTQNGVGVGDGWSVAMKADKKTGTAATLPLLGNETLTVDTGADTFSMYQAIDTAAKEMTATLHLVYTSGGAASKWENRSAALVFTPAQDCELPADARIELDLGTYSITGSRNQQGNFVIPVGELAKIDSGETATKQVKMTLLSEMLPVAETSYSFAVDWYMANSVVGEAPMNGEKLAILQNEAGEQYPLVLSKSEDKIPSLQVIRTDQLVTNGQLRFTLQQQNLDGYYVTMSVQMMSNETHEYGDTGQTVQYEIEGATITDTVNLQTNLGNNRLRFVVTTVSGEMVLEVFHYFVVTTSAAISDTRKILYYENFVEPDGMTTGRYVAYQTKVPTSAEQQPTEHILEAALYQHEGYMLMGWSAEESSNQKIYLPGETLFFRYDANSPGHVQCTNADGEAVKLDAQGNLILYALWQANEAPTTG